MQAIELGRHEEAPTFELPPPPTTGEFCAKCGSVMYPTLIRCPHCQEPYPGSRRGGGPSIRVRASQKGRRLSPLFAAGIAVALVAAAGIGVLVYYLTLRDDGAESPQEVVRLFYGALLQGRVQDTIRFLHPAQQQLAKSSLEVFEKAKLPVEKVVARVIQSSGMKGVDFELGEIRQTGEDRGQVEVTFKRDGLPVRRLFTPVARESGRWYVQGNPFVSPGH
jgi:hypothetical protein